MKEVAKKLIIKDDDNYNEDKLRRYHLPIIKSVNQLLSMISFTSEDERKFFYSNNRKTFLYREITVHKRNGNGLRTIEIPDPKVKEIQQVLNKYIFSKFRMANSCHGFVKNKSILTNALPHVGAKTLMKFDIKDFFPSITLNLVVQQLRFFGYGINVSKYIGYLCVNKDFCLPQGAPTSPYISNLICINIDKRIEGYCKKYNYKYTRYADDISISSTEYISDYKYEKIKEFIKKVLDDEKKLYSFKLNEEKCHKFVNGQKMIVTGIVINSKATVNKSVYRELDNAIRYIKLFGVNNHVEHLELDYDVYSYKQHLYGLAYFVNMVNPDKAKIYLNKLNSLNFDEESHGDSRWQD